MDSQVYTTVDMVKRNARIYPYTQFVNFYDEIVTYWDLDLRSDTFAAWLQDNGVKKGDIVSFMMGNSPYFFYTLFGINKAGLLQRLYGCFS